MSLTENTGAARGQAPRTIGPVTQGAAVGGVSANAIGQAIADLIVHAWPQLADVSGSLTLLLTSGLTLAGILVGGWLVRRPEPDTAATRAATSEDDVLPGVVGPQGEEPSGY